MDARLYRRLQHAAANEQIVTYSEVAPLVGLDMNLPDDRAKISALLDEISGFEHSQGRPLLSVVVVQSESGRPGNRNPLSLRNPIEKPAPEKPAQSEPSDLRGTFYGAQVTSIHQFVSGNEKPAPETRSA